VFQISVSSFWMRYITLLVKCIQSRKIWKFGASSWAAQKRNFLNGRSPGKVWVLWSSG
jgi:hypothetical protein